MSVDATQGREWLVVLISLSRVGTHPKTFLESEQRICVMMSRAKSELIICGDLTFMKSSNNLGKILWEAYQNKAIIDNRASWDPSRKFTGKGLSWDIEKMKTMTVSTQPKEASEEFTIKKHEHRQNQRDKAQRNTSRNC